MTGVRRWPLAPLSIAVALVVVTHVAGAQLPDVGARVRVSAPSVSQHRLVGRVLEPIRDSLVIGPQYLSGARQSMSLSSVRYLDVSIGRTGSAKQGVRVAAIATLAATGICAATVETGRSWCVLGGVVFGLPALGVGGIVGSFVRHDIWRRAYPTSAP